MIRNAFSTSCCWSVRRPGSAGVVAGGDVGVGGVTLSEPPFDPDDGGDGVGEDSSAAGGEDPA
jgi:hypothetical protein